MAKRQTYTEAEVRRFIKAGRAEDPNAVVEIETDKGIVRFRSEDPRPPENPFDAWKAKRNEGNAKGH
ncbi:hypothetical protein M3484_20950 [Pseudomonas sp. GX19020]|uniref:hypothetical protein n=1 Tax=Pseudomonas sp. GX19020 TaxID=2942277 RepID=UPI00201A0F2C|nr:hypothetical protein [Pseudomonas sp. GX19020]MCL4069030.1 hypothetical protein [Pseudomonas sp. GX19020]